MKDPQEEKYLKVSKREAGIIDIYRSVILMITSNYLKMANGFD